MKIIKLFKKDIMCLFNIKNTMFIFISVIALCGLIIVNVDKNTYTISDVFFKFSSGPNVKVGIKNTSEILIWFWGEMTLICVVGKFIYDEFKFNYIYSILRIQSKTCWIISKIVSLFVYTIVYYIIIILVLYVFSKIYLSNPTFRFNNIIIDFEFIKNFKGNEMNFMISNFKIIILESYLSIIILLLLNILTLNTRWSFFIIVIYQLVSINSINKYIPINNSVLSLRLFNNLGNKFSLLYIISIIIIVLFTCIYMINIKEDLKID